MTSNGVTAWDRVLAELAALGPADGDALNLLAQVQRVAVFADQVLGELARLAGVVDRTGAYAEAGYSSAAAFLRHGCGRSAARAGELVAVGRALPQLSATGPALASGQVSFDAAHVIARAASQIGDGTVAAAAEQAMVTAATTDGSPSPEWVRPGLDPRELRRLGEDLVYRADPDAVEERQRKRFERRYLSFGLTLDDVGTISGACSDGLSMEIIKTAAEAFGPPGGAEDHRTASQRRMDGLTAACQAALDSGRAGTRHGAMPHVTILLEDFGPASGPGHTAGGQPEGRGGQLGGEDQSAGGRPDLSDDGSRDRPQAGLARTGHGALLTAAQVLALACRAEISVIRWRKGLPLDVGRRYRTETPAIRRALNVRDRGCRFPGCGLPATWCTAHHIRPWKHGGRTRLSGLVLLCFVHHQYYIHLLGWTLSGSPDGDLQFTHPNRSLVLDSPLPAQPASRSP